MNNLRKAAKTSGLRRTARYAQVGKSSQSPFPGMLSTTAFSAALLVLMTLLAYIPALRGGYIWDDDVYLTQSPTVHSPLGLLRIWFEVGATPQYYPLVHTMFWIENRLWGLEPFGYHLVNVLLHSGSALVLWLMMRWLRLPGGWFAAAVFALHPVNVESVAWITERKNVLSGLFYLNSLWTYLAFDRLRESAPNNNPRLHKRSLALYGISLALFLCALLSKTVTCTLPAAILVIVWWQRGRIKLRDVLPLAPFFVLGVVLGLLTASMEVHNVGAKGSGWSMSYASRLLVAGRAVAFYLSKLALPYNLMFFYPRWTIDPSVWQQYLFPAAVLLTIGTLWFLRKRIGRGPVACALLYVGTLFPALGFFDVYPMRYSYVADHFQYHASLWMIAGICAVAAGLLLHLSPNRRRVAAACGVAVLLLFASMVWRRGYEFQGLEPLWRETIRKNPGAWNAHNNLANTSSTNRDTRKRTSITHWLSRSTRTSPNLTTIWQMRWCN